MKALVMMRNQIVGAEQMLMSEIQDSDSFKEWVKIIKEFKEAISELEALQQQNEIFKKAIQEREEQSTINHEKWEKLCLELQKNIKSLEAQLANTKQLTCGSCKTCKYAGLYVMGWMQCMNEGVGSMFKYGVNDYFGCKFHEHIYKPKDTQ